jgi:putative membrane protein
VTPRAKRARVAFGLAGTLALVAAVSPPMEHLAHATLPGHMVQHLLIGLVAPPLLVLASPTGPALQAIGGGPQRFAGAL